MNNIGGFITNLWVKVFKSVLKNKGTCLYADYFDSHVFFFILKCGVKFPVLWQTAVSRRVGCVIVSTAQSVWWKNEWHCVNMNKPYWYYRRKLRIKSTVVDMAKREFLFLLYFAEIAEVVSLTTDQNTGTFDMWHGLCVKITQLPCKVIVMCSSCTRKVLR